jgi:hypothetical protein
MLMFYSAPRLELRAGAAVAHDGRRQWLRRLDYRCDW